MTKTDMYCLVLIPYYNDRADILLPALLFLLLCLFGFFLYNSDTTVSRVAHDVVHNVGYLLLQFVNEQPCVVLAMLNVAQLFLPDASQFTTLQQIFTNEVNQFNARVGGYQTFALATYVVTFEECLYDASPAGRSSNAVFFHSCTQLFVFYEFASCLHSTQQCGFGVVGWRGGHLLCQCRLMRSTLTFGEGGESLLFFICAFCAI